MFAPGVQREGNRPAAAFPPETLSVLSLVFQPFLGTFPPPPISRTSLRGLSPRSPAHRTWSPPLGQPGRYRRRHLGSGRWGRGPRHGAGPPAGRRRGPAPPSLLARGLEPRTAEKLAGVRGGVLDPGFLSTSQSPSRVPLLTSGHRGSKPLFLSRAENRFLMHHRRTSPQGRLSPFPSVSWRPL